MSNQDVITVTSNHVHDQQQLVYDVFLSYNDSDTRLGFAGNLFNALRRKRFKTFMCNDWFKSGNQIPSSRSKALEGSKIAIVVLSKNYANHSNYLDELVKILEYKNRINQHVLPIFYHVDPYEVKYQTGWFGMMFDVCAMAGHDVNEMNKWTEALSQVCTIACTIGGGYIKNGRQICEYKVIQEIVKWVSKTLPRYNVFLSFSEEDTRYSFTGYLYNAFDREGFKIFMKYNNYKKKFKKLVKTIEKSKLSIIVLSENYAYSSSCLDELVTILGFMKTKNQLVWPIFYKVNPSDIRQQSNSYEKAMNKHENKFGKDSEKVKTWRSALFEVANLKGWHLKYGYEYELIEKIVETAMKI